MIHLECLNISQNSLEALPEDIGKLRNLEQLYLSSNSLIHIDPVVCRIPSLKVLSIEGNEINAIPRKLF